MSDSEFPSAKRRSRITIPRRAHPFAKLVFGLMQESLVSYEELAHRSGILKTTFKAWRSANRPGLESIESALGALGYTLVPVPKPENLPSHIRAKIEELGQDFVSDDATLGAAIAVAATAAWPAYAKADQAEHMKLHPGSIPANAHAIHDERAVA